MATAELSFPDVPKQGRTLPGFAIIGWRWVGRNPAVTIAPVLLPFIFLYFLSLISPPSLLPLEITGAMLFSVQNIGSWVLGDSAVWRIECSLQDLFVASPLGRIRYLFGIAFSNLIPMVPALAVLAALLDYELGRSGEPFTLFAAAVLFGVLTVMWVVYSSIGIALSSFVRSQRAIYPLGNLTFTCFGMLAPLYYPLSALPFDWQIVARFLPATYAALLVQGAIHATPTSAEGMLVDAGLLLLSAGAAIVLALGLYRWRTP